MKPVQTSRSTPIFILCGFTERDTPTVLQVLEVPSLRSMSTESVTTRAVEPHWHTIREASLLCGLPESTLRYYESIGILGPIARDPSSGHRSYSDADMNTLDIVSCLSATGMPLEDMKAYLRNTKLGQQGAQQQMELLDEQALRLSSKLERLKIQQAYVNLKLMYWSLVSQGKQEEAQALVADNRTIIDEVKQTNEE
ncbi:transcriptional regulator, MerR family [Bifidobacterium tsurumiense]|uniref:Transcriptional regulator, MerR family n=2 Tax=Bifidobacterium tsurumiense TaxID=356829 RepID=A0A087EKP9_9BIFI|nr:transcriptional regulator, MerR family [Bifidobacterium tsurumiense]